MGEVRNWVFTICGGALICGIVSALVPSKSFEKAIQLLLGVFILFCFLTPMHLEISLPTVDIAAAEQRRLAVAEQTGEDSQSLLLRDIEESADTAAAALLAEYDVGRDEYSLSVLQTEGGEVAVRLTLPARLPEAHCNTIASRLQQLLGTAVTAERTDSTEK